MKKESVSVKQVIENFRKSGYEIRQGTVESFRSKLVELGVLPNNTPMNEKHEEILKKAYKEKVENQSETWDAIMYRCIMSELEDEIKRDFQWEPKSIIEHLTWAVKKKLYEYTPLEVEYASEGFHIFEICINNFVAMGKKNKLYENSFGTDGNPMLSYRIKTRDDNYYFLIGKLNHYTQKEEIHIFYNRGLYFDPMVCSYICGGSCDENMYHELWRACNK